MELIHSEDREEFKRQLTWNSMLPTDKANLTLHEIMMPGNVIQVHVNILVKSSNRPPMFLSIFFEAISTVTIQLVSLNRSGYQLMLPQNN